MYFNSLVAVLSTCAGAGMGLECARTAWTSVCAAATKAHASKHTVLIRFTTHTHRLCSQQCWLTAS